MLKKAVIAARGEIEHTKTEKSVLSRLDHPFLAKLHYSFQTNDSLFIVMDFINGGELFHHLSREKRFSFVPFPSPLVPLFNPVFLLP